MIISHDNDLEIDASTRGLDEGLTIMGASHETLLRWLDTIVHFGQRLHQNVLAL